MPATSSIGTPYFSDIALVGPTSELEKGAEDYHIFERIKFVRDELWTPDTVAIVIVQLKIYANLPVKSPLNNVGVYRWNLFLTKS